MKQAVPGTYVKAFGAETSRHSRSRLQSQTHADHTPILLAQPMKSSSHTVSAEHSALLLHYCNQSCPQQQLRSLMSLTSLKLLTHLVCFLQSASVPVSSTLKKETLTELDTECLPLPVRKHLEIKDYFLVFTASCTPIILIGAQ